MKCFVLSGEGIECESELVRFLKTPVFNAEPELAPIPKLLHGRSSVKETARAGDWVFLPGGFSYADHFGSGKLLAFKLRESGFFEWTIERGLNLFGICNGFQVLVETGIFGREVSLQHNSVAGRVVGFVNRWVECVTDDPDAANTRPYRLCVRHGEGRLQNTSSSWELGVKPFLFYKDASFSNGSVGDVAGLYAIKGASRVFGMMPHPEVSGRLIDHPDGIGPEYLPAHRNKMLELDGDGVRLMTSIFKMITTPEENT